MGDFNGDGVGAGDEGHEGHGLGPEGDGRCAEMLAPEGCAGGFFRGDGGMTSEQRGSGHES